MRARAYGRFVMAGAANTPFKSPGADGIVIVGGGLAAQRCCEKLRSRGFEGRIRVVCQEPRAPYDRPPLSKDVLAGERDPATLDFRSPEWYAEREIELLLGESASSLDTVTQRLRLASGANLHYEAALIATGSLPRSLPSLQGLRNAHTLRTIADAARIRDDLRRGGPLVVIGAGFIGLEVAATARRLGVDVTVVEAAPAPLMRVLPAELGNWFADLHRAEGVEVLLSAQIVGVGAEDGRAAWVELQGGRRIACDALMVGVGIEPATRWLGGSGLDPDGVHADPSGRTAAPNVYAAGDAARLLNPRTGQYQRSEHWEAAAHQGAQAARAMLGLEAADQPVPSVWTDQYGIRIRTLGDARDCDAVELDGDPGARDFTAVMLRDGMPVAGLIAGRPRELPELRRRIELSTTDERNSHEVLAAH